MEKELLRKAVVLLPAYKPDNRLPAYAQKLSEAGIGKIVVVDDGSGSDFQKIFDQTSVNPVVHVIQYMPNKGKGEALRTGLRWIQENWPEGEIIVTADSDGQHRAEDVLRLIKKQAENGDGLLLGSRDFSRKDVPFRSRFGNRITTLVFRLCDGQWVRDTQTGLRAFHRKLLPMMLEAEGDRYEYEMNVLIACAQNKVPINALTIETIYENNNECSHFRPLKDGARIYKVILGNFLKFAASSLVSFCVDYLVYLLLNVILKNAVPGGLNQKVSFWVFSFVLRIGIATATARIISSIVNYELNKHIVFHRKNEKRRSSFRFLLVVLLNLFLSTVLVSSLHVGLGISENLIKIPVDTLLFFLSYTLQKYWVFPENANPLPSEKKRNPGHM